MPMSKKKIYGQRLDMKSIYHSLRTSFYTVGAWGGGASLYSSWRSYWVEERRGGASPHESWAKRCEVRAEEEEHLQNAEEEEEGLARESDTFKTETKNYRSVVAEEAVNTNMNASKEEHIDTTAEEGSTPVNTEEQEQAAIEADKITASIITGVGKTEPDAFASVLRAQ